MRPTAAILCLFLAGVARPAFAAPLHSYGGLAIAPAGDRVASIEDDGSAKSRGKIVVRSVSDGHVLASYDPCAKCSYSGLTFGPHGDLAFLARDRAASTVTLDRIDGGKVRPLATIAGLAQRPRFSPDGTRIALLVTIGAQKEAGATQAGVRQVGEIGEHSDEQQLAVFGVGGKSLPTTAVKPLSPAGRYIYEYAWTPDGRTLVATTALGNGDNNWWVATLDAIDASTGAVRTIAKPSTQVNFPRVSPDGRTVAYIGGLMSDFGSVGGDVWEVPLAGGEPVNRTAGYKATVTSLDWTGGGLRATTLSGADASVVAFDPREEGRVLWSRPASFSAGDGKVVYSADGRTMATVVEDWAQADAIYAGPVDAPHQITHDNDALAPIASARSLTWRSGPYTVQGWLLAPLRPDPSGRAPMITIVHGGPAAASTPYFFQDGLTADFLRAGYYVFYPNPRGSYGQGEAFTAANKRDFGGGDLKDILAGIDTAEKAAPIDDNRLGLTGGSYGGFMAMFANTQTNRFKAIVAGAGLSDWISYYGTNGIDQWMLPYFGKTMYEDPEAYRAVSAVNFARQAKTPTFIYVGERDIEVPPTQSIEWWHALKDMGVPTSLVIYPGEGHGLRDPANSADAHRRTLDWFARYLQPAK